jgi:hypothetical protein
MFTQSRPGKEFVVKPNVGQCGNEIKLFPAGEEGSTALYEYAKELLEGGTVLLEERIVPPVVPQLREEGKEHADYNFRIITTLDPKDPQVIDGEIRYTEKGYNPVNVSKGANAARLDTLEDPELAEQLNEVAREAVRIVCNAGVNPDVKLNGFAGADLLIDEDWNVHVIEVNTSSAGGFGTLTRLDGAPLPSIQSKLIPALHPYLNDKFQERTDVSKEDLRPIPHDTIDKRVVCEMLLDVGDYVSAEKMLVDISRVANAKWVTGAFRRVAEGMGSYEKAIETLDYFTNRHKDDATFSLHKVDFLRKADRFDEAQACVEAMLDNQKLPAKIRRIALDELFFIQLGQKKEEEAIALLSYRGLTSLQICARMARSYAGIDKERATFWMNEFKTRFEAEESKK